MQLGLYKGIFNRTCSADGDSEMPAVSNDTEIHSTPRRSQHQFCELFWRFRGDCKDAMPNMLAIISAHVPGALSYSAYPFGPLSSSGAKVTRNPIDLIENVPGLDIAMHTRLWTRRAFKMCSRRSTVGCVKDSNKYTSTRRVNTKTQHRAIFKDAPNNVAALRLITLERHTDPDQRRQRLGSSHRRWSGQIVPRGSKPRMLEHFNKWANSEARGWQRANDQRLRWSCQDQRATTNASALAAGGAASENAEKKSRCLSHTQICSACTAVCAEPDCHYEEHASAGEGVHGRRGCEQTGACRQHVCVCVVRQDEAPCLHGRRLDYVGL